VKQLHLISLSIWLTTAASTLGRAQQAHSDTTAGAKIQAAEGAARRWLALVDATAYEASWDSAAAMFRHQITRGGWQDAVIAARLQVDPLGARRQVGAQYTRELPNVPPGDYVLLQFSTAARDKTGVSETVVLTMDPDGTWRVAGYFIKPQ